MDVRLQVDILNCVNEDSSMNIRLGIYNFWIFKYFRIFAFFLFCFLFGQVNALPPTTLFDAFKTIEKQKIFVFFPLCLFCSQLSSNGIFAFSSCTWSCCVMGFFQWGWGSRFVCLCVSFHSLSLSLSLSLASYHSLSFSHSLTSSLFSCLLSVLLVVGTI